MKINKQISHKPLKKRYRLSFQSENTLNELWSFRLTKAKAIAILILVIIAFVSLITIIIVGTPLRTLLPGYLKVEQRTENISNTIRLDSLEYKVAASNQYFENLKKILNDEVEEPIIEVKADTLSITVDSLLQSSERERDFVKKYEQEEKFNISVLAPLAAEGFVFSKPVSGEIIEDKNKTDGNYINGIKILSFAGNPVASIYAGTVISVTHSITYGTEITIQHSNGFISKYKGLGYTYVSQGDKVSAAQRIGAVKNRHLTLEMWHNGTAVNPQEFISF